MTNAQHIEPGQTVGERYRIDYKIGEGGFGDVFRASELGTGRSVAIKTLRNEVNAQLPDLVQRFEREFTLARKLRHPGIVQMYDYGRLPDGTLFMAMEYIAGEELERVLRREKRLPVERARTLVLQVLDALSTAHAMGVVHRDLKPSNVMLTQEGLRTDVVKLLDFGVAKAFDGTYADLTAQNLAGSVGFGTPQYMAPEQIFGQSIGPHTDLYAAGLIFVELVTGRAPMLAATPTDIIQRQLQEEVPVPDWLRRSPLGPVLERALAKDWRQRFGQAAEMYAALERAAQAVQQPGWGVPDLSISSGEQATVLDAPGYYPGGAESGEAVSPHEVRTMLVSGEMTAVTAAPTMAAQAPVHVAPPTMVTRAGGVGGEGLAPPGQAPAARDGLELGGVIIPMPLVIALVVVLALVILLAVFLIAG